VEYFSEPLESTQATTSLTSLRSGCTESVWTRAPGCIDSAQRGKPHPSADLLESSSSSSFNPCNHVFIPVVAGQGSPLRFSARAARVLRPDGCLFLDCSHFGRLPEGGAWCSLIFLFGFNTSRWVQTFHNAVTFHRVSPAKREPAVPIPKQQFSLPSPPLHYSRLCTGAASTGLSLS